MWIRCCGGEDEFVEEGRVCGCTSLLGQEFVVKMY
jgi:hypothetical protein